MPLIAGGADSAPALSPQTPQRFSTCAASTTASPPSVQGIAHRGASGGTADVHLAPPAGDGWLPREDTAVEQPSVVRMVSWQDAHGKDLYTVREFEPSEGGITEDEMPWEPPRACCRLM
ncbi:hypothetical protein WJX81_007563 [Elliptochloris bilobata]|uniref:Uncharacterized protein n=1 Tax=Elliptochloris bilobata TaxID=381761 RepID=A0AAW1RI99_9CHLO